MAALNFDPQTGFSTPETAALREAIAQDWRDAFFEADAPLLDTDPVTPAGQLIDLQVAEVEAKNGEILYLASQFNPYVAEGRWQDALGKIYFLERKRAEPTIVTCQISGLYGTQIPYGALAKSMGGHTLICNRAVAIGADGKAETTFRVAEYGAVDIPPNSVNQIVTVIPGWDTIGNAAAGVLGRVAETRAEFELRRRQSVFNCAHGTVGAVYSAIAALDGVLDCAVLENISDAPVVKKGVEIPAHGIVACVYGGDGSEIAKAIYERKDAGCATGGNTVVEYSDPEYSNAGYEYRILRPQAVNFYIRLVFGQGNSLTYAQADKLKAAVFADFHGEMSNPRIGLGQVVYASRFYCPANSVEGANFIQRIEIRMDGGTFSDFVEIMADQEPVLAMANIIIEGV